MMVEDLGKNEVYDKCVEKSMINDKKKKRKGLMCGTLLSVRVERLTQTVSNPRTRGSEVWSYC